MLLKNRIITFFIASHLITTRTISSDKQDYWTERNKIILTFRNTGTNEISFIFNETRFPFPIVPQFRTLLRVYIYKLRKKEPRVSLFGENFNNRTRNEKN